MKFAVAVVLTSLLAVHGSRESVAEVVPRNEQTCDLSTVPLYRLYSDTARDHFYTTNYTEAQEAINSEGYVEEGITANVLPTSSPLVVPLYRMFDPISNDHFYTTSEEERMIHLDFGYEEVGISGYVYPKNDSCHGTVPLYQLYGALAFDHFYTASLAEKDSAIRGAYVDQGIVGYVYPQA